MSKPTILEYFDSLMFRSPYIWVTDKVSPEEIAQAKRGERMMRDAIRALIESSGKGPEVDEGWVRRRVNEARSLGMSDVDSDYFVRAILKEAGVRVKEKT
jgi:hypothetical protein